jgi:glycosyltransferase involved in cell wall biosynthesis
MKISVITVCYNSAETIGHTLRSVREQIYGNIEHIVVDGMSTDNTLDVVAAEGKHVAKLISEKDSGIYDAMNKGITLATGDVIGFINADDFYASASVLTDVAAAFEKNATDSCYGDLCYVSQSDPTRIVRYWRSNDFLPRSFEAGWCPPHPTFFVRRSVYERLGGFNLSFKIAADFELMARYLESAHITSFYIPDVLVKMRLGGTTNKNLSNIVLQNKEILRALQSHGLRSSVWRLFSRKLISRGLQFFVRPKQVCA